MKITQGHQRPHIFQRHSLRNDEKSVLQQSNRQSNGHRPAENRATREKNADEDGNKEKTIRKNNKISHKNQ